MLGGHPILRVAATPRAQPPHKGTEVDPNAPVPPSYDPNAAPPPPPAWNQAPGWQTPAPAKSGGFLGGLFRTALGKIIGLVVVVGIVIGIGVFADKVLNVNHRGEVVFATTDQSTNDNCKITNRVDSVKVGEHVYYMVMWSHKMGADEKVIEEVFKDGTSLGTDTWSASDYVGFDCTTVSQDISVLLTDPGKYEIKLTVGKDVVADGTLTVTP